MSMTVNSTAMRSGVNAFINLLTKENMNFSTAHFILQSAAEVDMKWTSQVISDAYQQRFIVQGTTYQL